MARDGRRWYLNPASRQKIKRLIEAEEGSYRAVGLRLGISYASLHRIAAGVTKSSWVIPDLLRHFELDPSEHLELGEDLTDEQVAWLKLLSDLQQAGKDPAAIEASIRLLSGLPPIASD